MKLSLLNNTNHSNRNKNEIIDNAIKAWILIPTEILENIYNLIPDIKKVNLCKTNYFKYHALIKSFIPCYNYESYIRSIIRYDHSFVFERVLTENITKWLYWKSYRYKNSVYPSFLYYIFVDIDNNNAQKCKKIFIYQLEIFFSLISTNKSASLNIKNWFKNNNIKNVKIQWTT